MTNPLRLCFHTLLGMNPYQAERNQLQACGIEGVRLDLLVADLTRFPGQAEGNLAAAVVLAQGGVEVPDIVHSVSMCRTILEREQITHASYATREQMVATAEMVAFLEVLTGNLGHATSTIRCVLRWKESVL